MRPLGDPRSMPSSDPTATASPNDEDDVDVDSGGAIDSAKKSRTMPSMSPPCCFILLVVMPVYLLLLLRKKKKAYHVPGKAARSLSSMGRATAIDTSTLSRAMWDSGTPASLATYCLHSTSS